MGLTALYGLSSIIKLRYGGSRARDTDSSGIKSGMFLLRSLLEKLSKIWVQVSELRPPWADHYKKIMHNTNLSSFAVSCDSRVKE
jgi:hypothetical protein